MKGYKNYVFAWTGVVILLVSSLVISAPRAVPVHDGRQAEPNEPFGVVQTSNALSIVPGNLPRTSLEPSFASNAQSSDISDDLSIDATLGDQHIVLKRRHRRPHIGPIVVIQIIGVLVGKPSGDGGHAMIDLTAIITGADAVRGSLVYGLAWLAGDSDPLSLVRALGYDIDVSKEHDRPCTEGLPGPVCVERARRLATLLDATLALGSDEDRTRFRQAAAALGIPTDCSLQAPVNTGE